MHQIKQKDNFYIIQPSVQLPISGIERSKENSLIYIILVIQMLNIIMKTY